MKPITKYTRSGRLSIAYQVFGEGSIDVVYIPGWVSNIDLMWENPQMVNFLTLLSKFARVILFDKRGTGLSDRVTDLSTLEERMDDIRAVMDAVGSKRAALFGHSEGGSASALFAATYPERTRALITFGVFAKRIYSADYPWAPTPEERQEVYDMIENDWGSGQMNLASLAPSMANDKTFMDWLARYFRSGASPSAAMVLTKMNTEVDIIDILDTIEVPTLLMYRSGDIDVKVEEGKFIAERIKNAKFVEFQGDDHLFWVGNTVEVLDEITKFLTISNPRSKYNRQLATIMFTDIADSTLRLTQMGDLAWMDLMELHNETISKYVKRYRGKVIKNLRNGILAVFDGPAKGVNAANEIRKEIKKLDLDLKIGIHTGECIFSNSDVTGLAVHIASALQDKANAGEVLITKTVKNLLHGTGLDFKERGTLEMPGLKQAIDLLATVEHESSELDLVTQESNPSLQNHSFLENVLQSIELHLGDEALSVEVLCKEVGIGERHLQRKLKAITNKSPNQLIRSVRLHRAKELLIGTDTTVSEAAFQTGFGSTSYFAKCFKKEFGRAPSSFGRKAG